LDNGKNKEVRKKAIESKLAANGLGKDGSADEKRAAENARQHLEASCGTRDVLTA